jgi:hypothetical protein
VEGRARRLERTRSGAAFALGAPQDGLEVELTSRARTDLAAAGVPLEVLEGRLGRLRGVARATRDGTSIAVDHPEQLELLQDRGGGG